MVETIFTIFVPIWLKISGMECVMAEQLASRLNVSLRYLQSFSCNITSKQ